MGTTVTGCSSSAPVEPRVLQTVEEALEHVHAICFKTGPPRRVGVELEFLLHHLDDPHRPVDLTSLRAALGAHAPPTLDPAAGGQPLPHGGAVTIEPGGQLEISTPPYESLATLHQQTNADLDYLTDRLERHGLRLGDHGIDPYRSPRQLLHTPRYDAMAASFGRRNRAGATMMCATAATQVCLDAGESAQVSERWQTLHALGPVLLALFATAGRFAGRDTGWASARMQAWLSIDPTRTAPVTVDPDPATAWGRYALAAPLLCLRRGGQSWAPPAGVTFTDWLAGAIAPGPTVEDLEYHLGTLFPPIRPRGYLEARFLDAQPRPDWFAPVAVLTALLADRPTSAAATERVGALAGQWDLAARHGLTHPAVRAAAAAVVELASGALARTDLPVATRAAVIDTIDRRLAGRSEHDGAAS